MGRLPLRDSVLVSLAVRYRVRADDIAGLRWSQVDLDAGTVGAVHVGRNVVTVTLAHDDLATLRDLHRARKDESLVFPSNQRGGLPISKRIVFRVVGRASRRAMRSGTTAERPMLWLDSSLKKLCRLADVTPISLHDLRRTGNTWLLTHRCKIHTGPVEEIVRERLLCHVPRELAAAYTILDMTCYARQANATIASSMNMSGGLELWRLRRVVAYPAEIMGRAPERQ
jgi:integrase